VTGFSSAIVIQIKGHCIGNQMSSILRNNSLAINFFRFMANGNYDLTFSGWQSVFADPIEFLNVFAKGSSFNTTGWKNTKFFDLIDQAENQDGNQPAKRWAKLVAAEKVLMADQGTIPLYQQAKSQLLRSTVKGIIYNPAGVPFDFTHAYIAQS